MAIPGSPAALLPADESTMAREIADLKRQVREQAAARSLAASQIGAGGLLINDGGSLTIEGTGSLNVGSGALNSAGTINAVGAITAGGVLTGSGLAIGGTGKGFDSAGNAQAAGLTASGNVAATGQVSGNTALFPGGVNSVNVYNRLLTYGGGYKNQYIHEDGSMGYVPSSRRFKQDVKNALVDPTLMAKLHMVNFRYIAAVENPLYEAMEEIGLIAEEVHALGLYWLVDYDEDGLPIGVVYERLALLLVAWAQQAQKEIVACAKAIVAQGKRIKTLEDQMATLMGTA